jgi:thiamine biosynthesis protein ThiI
MADEEIEPEVATTQPTVTYYYHPHELHLKGKNRPQFENVLTENIRRQMKAGGVHVIQIRKLTGRHYLTAPLEEADLVGAVSPRVFGIANYGRCESCPRDLETLKTRAVDHFRALLETRPIASFKIEASRVDKRYELTSPQLCTQIGAVVNDTLHIPVNLTNPAVIFRVEILDTTFVYTTEKTEGALGLPVRSSGSVVSLISGGFDSPVAAWMMMRRGCSIVYVHFHSAPFGEWRSSVSKIRKIVQQLSLYGGPQKFYAIPIGELQRQIATKAPEKLRVTLYRRLMMRVAKKVAEQHHCGALCTGDSLGQVASQTIDSMTTIQSVVEPMLILRPLLAFCKEEIIRWARTIGTHDISILPGGDCCSHMLPKNVATRPQIADAVAGEEKLEVDNMVDAAMQAAQLIDINEPWNEEADEAGAACPFTFQE